MKKQSNPSPKAPKPAPPLPPPAVDMHTHGVRINIQIESVSKESMREAMRQLGAFLRKALKDR